MPAASAESMVSTLASTAWEIEAVFPCTDDGHRRRLPHSRWLQYVCPIWRRAPLSFASLQPRLEFQRCQAGLAQMRRAGPRRHRPARVVGPVDRRRNSYHNLRRPAAARDPSPRQRRSSPGRAGQRRRLSKDHLAPAHRALPVSRRGSSVSWFVDSPSCPFDRGPRVWRFSMQGTVIIARFLRRRILRQQATILSPPPLARRRSSDASRHAIKKKLIYLGFWHDHLDLETHLHPIPLPPKHSIIEINIHIVLQYLGTHLPPTPSPRSHHILRRAHNCFRHSSRARRL